MTHDPLCPFAEWPEESCYQKDAGISMCAVISRVREDERRRDDDYAYAATQSYAAALRDSVEAVKAQTVALWSHPRDGTERTALWLDDAITAIEALGGER